MRKTFILLMSSLVVLTGCNGDPKATKITPELLENASQLEHVSNRLTPDDRAVFGKYVLMRKVSASTGLVSQFGKNHKDPATVGDAIVLMKAADVLGQERDAKLKAIDDKMHALDKLPDTTVEAHNQLVDEYNATQADYSKRIEALP